MLISKKIKTLNKLARKLVDYTYDGKADYVMIALESVKDGWDATVLHEFCGDGHPNYLIDTEIAEGAPICTAHGKTLTRALSKLEKRMIFLLHEDD